MKLEHPIDTATPIDHAQLYAELEQGERHWFTKEEEAEIQRNNALFYKHVPEEELFHTAFRFATAEDTEEKEQQLSAMRGMTAYTLSHVLPQIGERIHTMRGNVYRVVAC